jgi:hypothetical protein
MTYGISQCDPEEAGNGGRVRWIEGRAGAITVDKSASHHLSQTR